MEPQRLKDKVSPSSEFPIRPDRFLADAIQRACAAGFIQWCVPMTDENDVVDQVVSDSIDDHIFREMFFAESMWNVRRKGEATFN